MQEGIERGATRVRGIKGAGARVLMLFKLELVDKGDLLRQLLRAVL